MTARQRRAVAWIVATVAAFAGGGHALAQEADEDTLPPPPPEVQRLVNLAQDPERLRQLMADPDRVAAVMQALDTDAVREFMSDPRRVAEVMGQVDMQQVREAVRSVDRAKVREAMLARWKQRLKQLLGATDEEWKVLEPRILEVARAQREARVGVQGRIGGPPGRGRGGPFGAPPGDAAGPSEVEKAEAALREATEDVDLPGAEVARRLSVYRRARDRARLKLEEAERELKAVLTHRQEGILMTAGMLN